MKHFILTMAFGLLSFCVRADTTNVTLHIGAVSAARQPMTIGGVPTNSVTFLCEVTLDNQTQTPLTVTGLYTAFDGMRLVVLDASDKELARCGHADAFSTIKTQSFTLPTGQTTKTLTFPFCFVPKTAQAVRVKLEGNLPGSSFSESITSNILTVEMRK